MPGPEKRYSTTTVHLCTDDLEWARQRARHLGVSVSWVMRAALKAERLAAGQEALISDLAQTAPGRYTVDDDDVTAAFAYVLECDKLRDQEVPENQIPSFDVWRASRG